MAQLRLRVAVALMALAGLAGLAAAQPLTNSFVYQGELRSADSLFDGLADIRVTLWTAEIDGVQVGVTQEAVGVDVVGGAVRGAAERVQRVWCGGVQWATAVD